MSAKDLAFDRERTKYKKRINAAYDIVKELEEENLELKADKAELKEWVDRLLVYTELSEDDMRRKITAEKDSEEFRLQSAMFGNTSAWATLKG